jgi:hypothetical protein
LAAGAGVGLEILRVMAFQTGGALDVLVVVTRIGEGVPKSAGIGNELRVRNIRECWTIRKYLKSRS